MSILYADPYITLQDDTFLLGQDNFAASDVGSPLYGPIFRLQRSFTVDESPPPQARKERRAMMGGPGPGRMGLQRPVRKPATDDPEGEWPSLKHANWLLSTLCAVSLERCTD